MKTGYTKQDRDDAWLICAIAACEVGYGNYLRIAQDIGASSKALKLALKLAYQVWHEVCDLSNFSIPKWVDAEAAQLIAEGWEPKED